MATLTFSAGALTSTITANNTKAAAAFRNAALAWGYDGDINDNQAVADFVMAQLRNVITDKSREHVEREAVRTARNTARADESNDFDD